MQGVIILDCTSTNTRSSTNRTNIIRPLAPFGIHQVCVSHDIPSTVINYTDFWDPQELFDTLNTWCRKHRLERIVVACSTLFNRDVLEKCSNISNTISLLKQQYEVTLILGGPVSMAGYSHTKHKLDAVFQGRSLHLFEQWILGNDPVEHKQIVNDTVVYHNASKKIVENPIVPVLYDDYCLSDTDVLQFEVRLGCKFNCTFCTFEFRNAKDTNDADPDCLYNMFNTAKHRYGITRFSAVDDTFNEDDSKIDLLLNATQRLDYTPTIIGYTRFDILMRKPEQAEKLNRAGFVGHYFGIETLHPEASKLIKKGAHKEQALDFLEYLRKTYPHWHMCSGYIVGIPLEPVEHILEVMKEIRERQLINSIIPVDLGLYNIPGNEVNYSDFSKDPEKYGITVLGGNPHDLNWKHQHMNKQEAVALAKRIASKNFKSGITALDPWEVLSRDAIGYKKEYTSFDEVYSSSWIELSDQHIQRYIDRKKQFVRDLALAV